MDTGWPVLWHGPASALITVRSFVVFVVFYLHSYYDAATLLRQLGLATATT